MGWECEVGPSDNIKSSVSLPPFLSSFTEEIEALGC